MVCCLRQRPRRGARHAAVPLQHSIHTYSTSTQTHMQGSAAGRGERPPQCGRYAWHIIYNMLFTLYYAHHPSDPEPRGRGTATHHTDHRHRHRHSDSDSDTVAGQGRPPVAPAGGARRHGRRIGGRRGRRAAVGAGGGRGCDRDRVRGALCTVCGGWRLAGRERERRTARARRAGVRDGEL